MVSNKIHKALSLENVEYERIFRVFLPNIFCHSNHGAAGEVTLWYKISWSHVLTEKNFTNFENYLQILIPRFGNKCI